MRNFTDIEANKSPEHEINKDLSVNSALFFWLARKAEFAIRNADGDFTIGMTPSEHSELQALLTSPRSKAKLRKTYDNDHQPFALLADLSKHIEVDFVKDSGALELIFSPAAMLALKALKPLFEHDSLGKSGNAVLDTRFAVCPNLEGVTIVGKQVSRVSQKSSKTAIISQNEDERSILMFDLLQITILDTDIFLNQLMAYRMNHKDMLTVFIKQNAFDLASTNPTEYPEHFKQLILSLEQRYLRGPDSLEGERLRQAELEDTIELIKSGLITVMLSIAMLGTLELVESEGPGKYAMMTLLVAILLMNFSHTLNMTKRTEIIESRFDSRVELLYSKMTKIKP